MDRQIIDPDPGKNLIQRGNLRWRHALRNGKNKYTSQSSKS